MPKRIIPVQLPDELLKGVDAQVEQARKIATGATVTRSSMLRELIRTGLRVRQAQALQSVLQ